MTSRTTVSVMQANLHPAHILSTQNIHSEPKCRKMLGFVRYQTWSQYVAICTAPLHRS